MQDEGGNDLVWCLSVENGDIISECRCVKQRAICAIKSAKQ